MASKRVALASASNWHQIWQSTCTMAKAVACRKNMSKCDKMRVVARTAAAAAAGERYSLLVNLQAAGKNTI